MKKSILLLLIAALLGNSACISNMAKNHGTSTSEFVPNAANNSVVPAVSYS